MPSLPLQSPARFVPPFAVSFANSTGDSDVVSAANPLPVTAASASAPAVLAGSVSASGVLGPFQPVTGRPVMLSLAGTWAGQVKVLRSTDGGATKMPLTALGQAYGTYATNICEPVWEDGELGASLYLDVTLSSGAISYRMGQ